MTTKIKHEIRIDGTTFTRSSAHDYTHVVIGPAPTSYRDAIARAESDEAGASWWDTFAAIAADGVSRHGLSINQARDFMTANPDRTAYLAARRVHAIALAEKNNAKGLYGWQPISWHRSAALAAKAIRPWHGGARIVEVGSDITIS